MFLICSSALMIAHISAVFTNMDAEYGSFMEITVSNGKTKANIPIVPLKDV